MSPSRKLRKLNLNGGGRVGELALPITTMTEVQDAIREWLDMLYTLHGDDDVMAAERLLRRLYERGALDQATKGTQLNARVAIFAAIKDENDGD